MTHLKVGDSIPSFASENQNGELVTDQDLKGEKHVLFFYPKDDTPGCTREACSVRDNFKSISKKGYKIFGISPDKVKKHGKFIEKYEFQYPLLADPEKKMIQDFGMWGIKKFMGKEVTGVYRTTLITDENNKITNIIAKVKTKDHGDQILAAIEEIEEG